MIFSQYGMDGVLSTGIGTIVAKRVPDGLIVREYLAADEQGVFTAIPHAEDFHMMVDPYGSRTSYFQAGYDIYLFKYSDATRSSQASPLPVPMLIAGADASTFLPGLTPDLSRIAKDKDRAYVYGIPDSAIDAKTLSDIPGHPLLFSDASHLYEYTGGPSPYTVTSFIPPITFLSRRAELDSEFNGYFVDRNDVYFQKEKIAGADRDTFTVFTSPKLQGLKGSGPLYSYAKDRNSVYYNGTVVPHADPATFVPVDGEGIYSYYYGRDAKAVYEGTTTLPKLDPETIRVLWYPTYEGCGISPYVKDANHVFFQRALVPGADADTFEALINGYGRDKNGVWEGARFRPDLPKDFRPVCDYG